MVVPAFHFSGPWTILFLPLMQCLCERSRDGDSKFCFLQVQRGDVTSPEAAASGEGTVLEFPLPAWS